MKKKGAKVTASIAGAIVGGVIYFIFSEKLLESFLIAIFVLIIAGLTDYFQARKKIKQKN